MAKILVVDDEATYRDALQYNLHRDGFAVEIAADGVGAIEQFERGDIDLVLLDLMLPGVSGEEVCRRIRKTSNVPIIMLTAKGDEIDKVVGLELGADDYVTKPYSYRELVARVRALLRRSGQGFVEEKSANVLRAGRVELDRDAHEVRVDGEVVAMPLREFQVLEYLMENANRVLSRSQIFDHIWGYGYIGDLKTLDVHIKRIRSKIEEDVKHPALLLTVRGVGYKLVTPE